MNRFFLPTASGVEPELFLEGEEAHHALKVLRIEPGEDVIVLNGNGCAFVCRCIAREKNRLRLQIVQKNFTPQNDYKITLLQAIPKGKLIELIIQKAIELGITKIVPLITERVVAVPDEEDSSKKQDRWKQIAISAIKQCGQTWLPEIEPPIKLTDYLKKTEPAELSLLCALVGERKHPSIYFDEFRQKYRRNPRTVNIWIGPEGDFTPTEMDRILSLPSFPITLGNLVLRTETAAIYALSIVNYELSKPSP